MWWDTAAWESPTADSTSQAQRPFSPTATGPQRLLLFFCSNPRMAKRVGSANALNTSTSSFCHIDTYRLVNVR